MSSFNAADASALSQATVQANISTTVARRTLDVAEQQGQAAISLLEGAAQIADQGAPAPGSAPGPIDPSRGQNLDVSG